MLKIGEIEEKSDANIVKKFVRLVVIIDGTFDEEKIVVKPDVNIVMKFAMRVVTTETIPDAVSIEAIFAVVQTVVTLSAAAVVLTRSEEHKFIIATVADMFAAINLVSS